MGRTPTTPTTSSVIAGIQVQEAVKMLHGLPTIAGQGFVFDGMHHQSYMTTYSRLDDCPSHDAMTDVEPAVERCRHDGRRFARACPLRSRADGGRRREPRSAGVADMCRRATKRIPLFASLGKVTEAEGRCPRCGASLCARICITRSTRSAPLDKTLHELGVPPWDIVAGRCGLEQRYYEFAGDREPVLGPLAESGDRAMSRTGCQRLEERDACRRPSFRPIRGPIFACTLRPKFVAASSSMPRPMCRSRFAACWSAIGMRDENGPYAVVTDYIRCDNASSKFAEVTFTHESWAQINKEMDSRFAERADRRLVPFASGFRHFPVGPRLLHPRAFLFVARPGGVRDRPGPRPGGHVCVARRQADAAAAFSGSAMVFARSRPASGTLRQRWPSDAAADGRKRPNDNHSTPAIASLLADRATVLGLLACFLVGLFVRRLAISLGADK